MCCQTEELNDQPLGRRLSAARLWEIENHVVGRTTFPHLPIAREHGVAYVDVLLLSDRLEECGPESMISPSSPAWAYATATAWAEERERHALDLGLLAMDMLLKKKQ